MSNRGKKEGFPTAREDARAADLCPKSPQTLSPGYRLAFRDHDFLLRDELRPVRLQLELLKPELILDEYRIEGAIVIFGSARIPEPETAGERVALAEAAAEQDPHNPDWPERCGSLGFGLKPPNITTRPADWRYLFLRPTRPHPILILRISNCSALSRPPRRPGRSFPRPTRVPDVFFFKEHKGC
jgi:hypothetical protein